MTKVKDGDVEDMRRLSGAIGCCIVYVVEDYAPYEAWGQRFVPIADWRDGYQVFRRKHSSHLEDYLNL